MAGGKWTTYREMAEDAIDLVVRRLKESNIKNVDDLHSAASSAKRVGPCVTLETPLVGRCGWDRQLEVTFPNYTDAMYFMLLLISWWMFIILETTFMNSNCTCMLHCSFDSYFYFDVGSTATGIS